MAAKVFSPTVWEYTPDESKSHDDNVNLILSEIMKQLESSPNKFRIVVTIPIEAMDIEEMNELINNAHEEVLVKENTEIVPVGADSDGEMTFKMRKKINP